MAAFSSLFVFVVFSVGIHAQEVPMFSSEDPVKIKVIAPLKLLKTQRGEELEELPGQVVVAGNDGSERTLDMQIVALGNFRRQKSTCDSAEAYTQSDAQGEEQVGRYKVETKVHCNGEGKSRGHSLGKTTGQLQQCRTHDLCQPDPRGGQEMALRTGPRCQRKSYRGEGYYAGQGCEIRQDLPSPGLHRF